MTDLRAPFPYFGGKSRAAPLVWERFGTVINYVEPFFGSGAVLLSCPETQRPRVETVNDLSCFLANFWRATKGDPDAVASAADWPVNECVPAGTMIATPSGDVPVERVTEGMIVWGFEAGRVVQTMVVGTKESRTEDALVRVGSLSLTPNHPVWTAAGYIEAGSLEHGMTVKVMVYDEHGPTLGDIHSVGPEDQRGPLCRDDVPRRETAVQRASVSREDRRENAPGLLDSVAVDGGRVSGAERDRSGARRKLAGDRATVDRASFGSGDAGQSHDRWRRDAGAHSERSDAREVVREAKGRAVCSGAHRGHEGAKSLPGSASQDRSGGNGTDSFVGSEGQDIARSSREDDLAGATSGDSPCPRGQATYGRAQGQDRRCDDEPSARDLRINGRSLRLDHRRLESPGSDGGEHLSGAPQGLPLQRPDSAPGVARTVYNFQTTTGNYFAAGVLVHNCDLHSRHKWLLAQAADLRARLDADPDYFDARIAGWWVWGASAWIGTGWCEEGKEARIQLPMVGGKDSAGSNAHPGRGIHAAGMRAPSVRLPDLGGGTQWGTSEPNARAGRGVHSQGARGPSQQLPDVGARSEGGGAGRGVLSSMNRTRLFDIFSSLSARLRHVRVAGGDFERILTDAVTHRHGLTAVFLDPPYEGFEGVYGAAESVAARARAWALQAGERADMRIALCGYEGEHAMPATWECVHWKAKGGYSNAAKGGNNGNARRERIWFSPACLRPGVNAGQISLFGSAP